MNKNDLNCGRLRVIKSPKSTCFPSVVVKLINMFFHEWLFCLVYLFGTHLDIRLMTNYTDMFVSEAFGSDLFHHKILCCVLWFKIQILVRQYNQVFSLPPRLSSVSYTGLKPLLWQVYLLKPEKHSGANCLQPRASAATAATFPAYTLIARTFANNSSENKVIIK